MGMELRRSARMPGWIPTYNIVEAVKEDAGCGSVRITNYALKGGVLVPEFEVVIAASKLLTIGRTLSEFAQDILRAEQLRLPGMKVH